MFSTEDFIKSLPWLLPLVLLVLKFVLKLWIAEQHNALNLWKGVLQTPVDIGFLSLSLIASAIIKASGDVNVSSKYAALVMALVISFIYVALIAISIVLWKATPTNFTKRDICIATIVGLLNYALTIGMLVYGVILIKPL
ncbi:MAG TPA: hypothetical protein VGX24_13490 [Pyrinomonadaceae bacterium]|jgi:hypothetical protein|nr:hypothetical protein [Pyrinomonadaceae bacterium]